MKRFRKYLIFILIGLVFIGTFAYLFKRSKPKEIRYEELTPAVKDIVKSTVVTGKIQPRDEVNVKAQISGIVAELYKEAGQLVEKNEVIAKLKVIPEMSQLSAAQSRVRLSEVNLKQAQTNYDREKKLFDQQLVSAEAFEQVAQALKQAKEEYNASVEALEIIRDGVSSSNKSGSSTLVRSSVSGLILDVPVKVGNTVINSNTFNDGTTIATVADMDDLIFDGNIDETEVGRLSPGMPVKITIGALQDVSFDAVLEYISPKAIENNGVNQFEIKASVKIPDEITIRSGYSANAEIVLQEIKQVLSVPESALQFEGDSTYVFLVTENGYERRDVVTGLSDGVNIEIKEGLSAGEKVRGNQILNEK
jgi:RND family efflux transporter, MFP subunit